MSLAQDLSGVVAAKVAADLQNFRSDIDPRWIEEALQATGTATVRRRRLPAEQVLWLVIGMGMMRDRPIADVVSALDLSLPDAARTEVAPSAIVQARQRLGEEPVAYLFHRTADVWAFESAAAHRWRGLQLFGVDGTTLRVADSEENREHFGLASGGERGQRLSARTRRGLDGASLPSAGRCALRTLRRQRARLREGALVADPRPILDLD